MSRRSGAIQRRDTTVSPRTCTWSIIHALAHLRDHIGHAQLTRQLILAIL